jgi:hypothetical protein
MPRIVQQVTLAALLIATCNLLWPIVPAILESLERPAVIESADGHFTVSEACTFGPPISVSSRIWIELLLVIAFIGSHSKCLGNTFLTIFGLAGTTFVYLSWWRVVFRISANAGVPIRNQDHFAYLWDGNLVDLTIAAVVAWLIVMNVTLSFKRFFSPSPTT